MKWEINILEKVSIYISGRQIFNKMKTDFISALTNIQKPYHIQSSANVQQPTFDEVLKKAMTKSITLEPDVKLNLGTINDKPFQMRIFSDGGAEWNGSPRIFGPMESGQRITEEVRRVHYAAEAYTRKEHEKAEQLIGIIYDLYLTTTKGWSIDFMFNGSIDMFSIPATQVEEALQRLGLAPKEPFTINGRTFILEAGYVKEMKTGEDILSSRPTAEELDRQGEEKEKINRKDYSFFIEKVENNRIKELSQSITDFVKESMRQVSTTSMKTKEEDPENLEEIQKKEEQNEEGRIDLEKLLNPKEASRIKRSKE